MPDKIDYGFISEREGGGFTTGYVPDASGSKSGVTIATGFDLGQRNEGDLKNLGLSTSLVATLKPYLGKKGKDAAELLTKSPLSLSKDDVELIDKAVKSSHVSSLRANYLTASENKSKTDFFELPAEAQTVIASVSFQYGIHLEVATPKFWKAVTSQDWSGSVTILNSFGDSYQTRRKLEAGLLDRLKPIKK